MQQEKVKNEDKIMGNKKRLLFVFLFILIAAISIVAIVGFNKSFSLDKFYDFCKSANPLWIAVALFSMVMFIFTEGCALKFLCKAFGYKTKLRDGFSYSSADIYFSAITPSATGGQPATAFFMAKDGIPLSIVTVSMFCVLMMYSVSLIIIDILAFVLRPGLFFEFGFMAKIIILVGVAAQFGLSIGFYCLLFNESLLRKICEGFISLLAKIHLIKNREAKIKKIDKAMDKYRESAKMLREHKDVMKKVLLFTTLQRIAQIMVIVSVFVATGGELSHVLDIWVIESFVITGAYCIPIPGAIGVSDYLMLNGFKILMTENLAVNLELIGRGISFYCCIILCGVTIFIKYLSFKRRSKNDWSI